jgi:hypothetical protein
MVAQSGIDKKYHDANAFCVVIPWLLWFWPYCFTCDLYVKIEIDDCEGLTRKDKPRSPRLD